MKGVHKQMPILLGDILINNLHNILLVPNNPLRIGNNPPLAAQILIIINDDLKRIQIKIHLRRPYKTAYPRYLGLVTL